jgi:hypothetical protein
MFSTFDFRRVVVDPTVWWTPDAFMCVMLGLTSQMASATPFDFIIGSCWPFQPFENRKKKKTRAFQNFRVFLVSKGSNFGTVLNTIQNWTELRLIDSRLTFHIILDENIAPELLTHIPKFVGVILVPQNYQPPKAKYKARALEYARIVMNLGSEDWVLHLDEETQIDGFAIRTCLDL